MRKIDLRLIPVVMFVFFYTILDASALVHAKVAGMTKALHMSDGQYHVALVMYPIAHMFCAMPAMWLMQRFGSKRWISLLVFVGGIFMFCTGFVTNPLEMIILRTIIGVLEAGLLPGIFQTITLMYPRKHVLWRFALAVTGGTIGGLVGSFIAFALTDIHTKHIQGWRFIFIIEGAITIIAAPLTYLWMPDSIKNCTYLTSNEKVRYEKSRSLNANQADVNMSMTSKVKLFFSVFMELKTLLALLLMICIYIPFTTLASNLPVMMQEGFGFKSKDAQVLSIPIKVMSAVLILVLAWFSDRCERRLLLVVGPVTLASIGCFASLATTNGKARYGLIFLAELVHVAFPSATMILVQNISCDTKRSTAMGMQGFLSGLASIVGAYLIWSKDAPRYVTAYLVLSTCCVVALLSCGCLFVHLQRENQLKQRQVDSGIHQDKSKDELRAMGDDNPYFFFRY